jgi:hypothetical protein
MPEGSNKMPRNLNEAENKVEYVKLPPIADLDQEKRARIAKLMESLDEVITEKLHLTIKEDDLKEELERLQQETGRTGFRHGWLIFCAQSVAGRRTLDKMLLLENGCPAAVLNASYVTGKPSTRVTFKHLEEEV